MLTIPGASETGQADHDTLHTAEAQVTSAESALGQGVQYTEHCQLTETQWTLYMQGRGGEVTQGQSGPTW